MTLLRHSDELTRGASSLPSIHIPSHGRSGRCMRTLTSRCGRGLTLLRSALPHQPRVRDDLDIKVCRCPRCREEIPSDDVNDDCSDNESDDDDYNPMPPGSVSSRSHLDQPMTMTSRMSQQSGNQPYYVVFAANNVTNLSLRPGAYLTTALCSLVAPMYFMPIFMFHTQSTYT